MRQGCGPSDNGGQFAPHRTSCRGVGSTRELPLITMATKTAAFSPISTVVGESLRASIGVDKSGVLIAFRGPHWNLSAALALGIVSSASAVMQPADFIRLNLASRAS